MQNLLPFWDAIHCAIHKERAPEGMGTCGKCGLVCLLMFCMAAGGFGLLLYYGASSGTAKLNEYFTMAEKASIIEIENSFHPALKKVCDPTALAMLIKIIPQEMGAFKKPEMNGFSFSDKIENGMRIRRYKGNMAFEKGTLPLEMAFVDDKLNAFYIRDEEAAKPLLAKRGLPKDTSKYVKHAEDFWRALLTGKGEEAFNLMSEPLQKQVGKQGMAQQARNMARNGAVKGLKLVKTMADPQDPTKLVILTECTLARATAIGHVSFQFAGLNSYFINYQIPSPFAKK